MTSEDIFKELGGLDPQLILNAAPDIPQKRRNGQWVKWVAIAASVSLLSLVTLPILWGLSLKASDAGPPGKVENAESSPYPFAMLTVGESTAYKDGEVTFQALHETSFTFTLTIDQERSDNEYTYSYDLQLNGWKEFDNGTTTYLSDTDTKLLKIIVNGEPVPEIPCAVGEYAITIDFSALVDENGTSHIADILIWGIASFDIDYDESRSE